MTNLDKYKQSVIESLNTNTKKSKDKVKSLMLLLSFAELTKAIDWINSLK